MNGDHPKPRGVFDLTTIGPKPNAARSLRSGRDLSGNDLHGAPHMFLGSNYQPWLPGFRARNRECAAKIDAGSQFFQSQAIYDTGLLAQFLIGKLGDVPLLAGVIRSSPQRWAGG